MTSTSLYTYVVVVVAVVLPPVDSCPGSIACVSEPFPADGVRYGSGNCPGDTVSFECDNGFILHGSSKRLCQENGQWSGLNVTCVEGGKYWAFINQKDNPFKWPNYYPKCGGTVQSPIDISTNDVVVDNSLLDNPLQLSDFDSLLATTFTNTGKSPTVVLDVESGQKAPQMTGGPLADRTYTMLQFHVHYGSTSKLGSEHTIDGKEYAGELHMVHWNSDWYNSSDEAISSPKGLSVLGLMIKVGDSHPEIEKLSRQVQRVKYEGWSMSMANVQLSAMLPKSMDYYTYTGSLTTPPCDETVTWILMKEPITVSSEQLDAFRTIMRTTNSSDKVELMQNNYRPPQPLNGRSVYLVSSGGYKATVASGVLFFILLVIGFLL